MNHPREECLPEHVPGYEIKEILVLEMGNQEFVYTPRVDTSVYESVEKEDTECNPGPECIIEEEDIHAQDPHVNDGTKYTVEEEKIIDELVQEPDGAVHRRIEEDPCCAPPLKKKRSRRSKGGRLDDDVWNYFTYSRDKNGKKVDLKCIYCHYRAKWPKIERLRTHYYESCPGATQDTVNDSDIPQVIHVDAITELNGPTQTNIEVCHTISSPCGTVPPKLMAVRRTKSTLDMQIGRFIFSSNLPFSVIENPEFVKLIKTLKPSYKLPTRRKLETSILDKVYDEVVGETAKSWCGRYVTVMQDGWASTQTASPVITHTLNLECRSTHFLNAVATTPDQKTTDHCVSLLLEAIVESERLHKCKVIAVVTDNSESATSVAARIQEKMPDMCTYACNSHLINLVGSGVCQGETLDDVKRIQRFFKDHTFPKGTLKKVLDPLVPSESKWTSQYACLQNFVDNHTAYEEIAMKIETDIPVEIVQKLKDLIFLNNVNNSIKNLRPIAKALKALQSETAIVAHAVKFWIDIKKEVEVPPAFMKRFGEILQLGLPPFACAAYLLHPKFRGEGLPPAYSETGLQWLVQKSSEYVCAQMKLSQDDKNYYSAPLMNSDLVEGVCMERDADIDRNRVSAANWWKDMGKKMGSRLPQGLAELAEKLQLLPASTNSTDRAFSTMGPIMTDTQNRIGGEKASKLYSIYRTLYDINDPLDKILPS